MTDPRQPRLEVWNGGAIAPTLRGLVGQMFGHRLEELHSWPHLCMIPGDVAREFDQSTRVHAQFYRKFPRIENYYRSVAMVLGRLALDEPFYVQKVPSFRVHFPRSRAVGEPHTDWQYGHQFGELNFWIPLTEARYSSTMWVADHAEGWSSKQYAEVLADEGPEVAFDTLPAPINMWPVNLELGQLLVWDSVIRAHGNLLNHEGLTEMLHLAPSEGGQIITAEQGAALVAALEAAGEKRPLKITRQWWEGEGVSRVSLDFRILPARLCEMETERVAVNTGVAMTLDRPGHKGYWTDPAAWS